jgi:DNA-binding MarR family transcriptional regulator
MLGDIRENSLAFSLIKVTKKTALRSPPTVGLPGLSGGGDETEFRDFMADLFAAAATMQSLRRRAAQTFSLSSGELAILLALAKLGNDRSIRKLADHLKIAASNVTADVRRLVELGHVRKLPDPDDSRAIQVELTREGKALIKRMAPALQSVNDVVFAGLSHDDMVKLSRMLHNIVVHGRRLY